LEFRILGPLAVTEGGRELPLRAAKPRTLLALLLLHRNEQVTSERLIDWLWDGGPPPTARTSLQVYVSDLRKLLGEGRLETRPGAYLLHVRPGEVDVERVERLVEEADGADPHRAAKLLRRALALFRSEPLPELRYHTQLGSEIARLEELRLHTRERLTDAQLALGKHAELVPELEALAAAHPLREELRSHQIVALYRCGRQAEALAAFQSLRRALDEELGLEPTPALRDLERRILNHDPTLAAPAKAWPGIPLRSRRRLHVALAFAALVVVGTVVGTAIELSAGRDTRPAAAENSRAIGPPTITQTMIGGVTLGQAAAYYKKRLGPWRAQELTEPHFPSLAFEIPEVAVYWPSVGRRADIITTWNRAFHTAAGIGPCSTLAAMHKAYGRSVKAAWAGGDPPHAYVVGDNLLLETDDFTTIAAVALYKGDPEHTRFGSPQAYAAYVAAVETPCR
jgi:DNA-binding SARP family transcriptional activator